MSSNTDNFLTGTAKGVAAMGAGIVGGSVALVAAPVMGAKSGGVMGFGKGLVGGVAGLTIGVVGGSVAGVVMIGKGIIQTPGAIAAFATDDDLAGKEKVDLSEVEVIEAQERDWDHRAQQQVRDEAAAEPEYTPVMEVKDRQYYDVLGCEPNASASALKRRYYVLARQEHPDKGGDLQKFQKIGEAYAVLSDPVKRKKYDEGGLDGIKNQSTMDPGAMFAMMFGEKQFDDYVGDLMQVITLRVAEDPSFATPEAQKAEVARLQTVRIQQLAKKLALRLDSWLTDKEAFIKDHLEKLEELLKVNLGPQMCASVGIMYEIVADSALGVRARFAQLGFGPGGKETTQMLKTQSRAFAAAMALQKEKDKPQEEQQTNRDSTEQHLFEVMALDIESAVSAAAKMALADKSISKDDRRERARGMLKLGLILQGKLPGVESGAAAAPAASEGSAAPSEAAQAEPKPID